ncbi:hypothetical protein A2U01_0046394, partial [Trifolium medium]|nr:hypothetical protein [Trifolium medium]
MNCVKFWRNAQCICAFLLHVLFPAQRARAGGATRSVGLLGRFSFLVAAQHASLYCATRSVMLLGQFTFLVLAQRASLCCTTRSAY